ncbi:hypothetical protein PR202_gb16672 [Eleusine coracana subsp. coracana]|uniref:Homeobox domain-containing protein n=1 Tax=Eleusine coracana subsp. coracana TaxID=191504 RepID=A0AAV5F0Z0_ELECO|nr:hypothetical protein QOZ80_9BG0695290 [Eleusine coracana subsp. coracana]GJN28533.1 hypothetical protein PR202_gb16672 [Eleusine coracana subsp. coracana]
MPQTPSTRWCPTPEQLMILEEMYRSGVRAPNAAEIQQITAHLAYYGRIEGKNVFYWFQNHKARERQRLRRRLCARHQQQYAATATAGAPSSTPGGGTAGVHPPPAAMHSSYATTSFIMPQPHHHLGFLGQQAAALPVVHHHPAAAGGGGGGNNNNKQIMATTSAAGDYDGGAASYNSSHSGQQEEWSTMEALNCSASPGSSDDGTMLPPCCRRPLRTLDLFPTKSSAGGLKDECNSSKSSSCSTSTN